MIVCLFSADGLLFRNFPEGRMRRADKCRHYTIFSFMIKLFYDKSMSFLQEKKEER